MDSSYVFLASGVIAAARIGSDAASKAALAASQASNAANMASATTLQMKLEAGKAATRPAAPLRVSISFNFVFLAILAIPILHTLY